ncbi:M48 family metallopeptidase [Chamaesiphon minutus]|uniref:Putative metal-dependent hydrolase n=1 Tax=Chamaesiphon minutus (strain ATCC 27169 / PCC 6605) TaxID=1173020 RepID=K9U9L6_CHAP6|nr:SprT family zinc-dependent metalloprotease [Chamaesiphon minutus]AFY91772.1 putative metal-dependent hydrolase [Chamaesiphon minutus PCC 6605]
MKSTEIHRVPYGSQNITFALEYSPRKTLAIEVHPDSSIIVKAPTNETLQSIESKVIHRAAWIAKQQRQFTKYAPPLPAPECVSGEGYRYLGRQYRLKLIESSVEKIRLWQGRLEVNTPTPFDREHVERSISNWFRDRAMTIFSERYQYCTKLVAIYGIIPEKIGFELRIMSKRWGSCTPNGKIFLNPLLVSAPKDCIDYVIIHELCHLRFPNHSASFYKLLESILPDWNTRKNYLNDRIELRLK